MLTAARAHAWCRVDLAGGTLDIWPLGILHPGAVTVNVAIGVRTSAEVTPRAAGYRIVQGDEAFTADALEELSTRTETRLVAVIADALALPPAEIVLDSRSPRGAGLGASSALAVALIAAIEHALGHPPSSADHRAALVRDLEGAMMQRPTGIQDQYPPQLGGALAIRYPPGGVRVERLEVDLAQLGAHLLVAYSGRSHISADTNWSMIRRRLDGDVATRDHFAAIAGVAAQVVDALTLGDWQRVGRLMAEEWCHRSALAEGVSTPEIEALLGAAGAAGAWGGKACGAGGGGCVAVLVPTEARQAVADALRAAGGTLLDAPPMATGVEVASA